MGYGPQEPYEKYEPYEQYGEYEPYGQHSGNELYGQYGADEGYRGNGADEGYRGNSGNEGYRGGNGGNDGYGAGGEYGYGDAYAQQRPEYPPFPEQGHEPPEYGHGHEHGYGPEYEQGYQSGYQDPYPPTGLETSGAVDPQWAMSGMGWEQRAWDEARLGVFPLQEYGQDQAPPQQSGFGGEQATRAPGRGSRRGAPAQEREFEDYQDPVGYGEAAGYENGPAYADPAGYGDPADYRDPPGYDNPARFGGRGRHDGADGYQTETEFDAYADEFETPEPVTRAAAAPADSAASSAASPAAAASTAPVAVGRGAFGAAGLGAILAVAGLATTAAVLVVVALVQLGVAYGWHLAAGLGKNGRGDRRSIVLTALIGWAASAVAFRATGTENEVGLVGALGVGFVVLAADLMLRRRVVLGDGERLAALAMAIGGALFVILPAGFVVAERMDTRLTAACASSAAVGVLCCALLGRDPLRGILAGLVAGAAVGALAATSFSAAGGLEAGALGGAVAAVASAAGSGALDRMAAEGGLRGSTRIVAQTLPIGLAAVGAVIATAMFR